MRLDETPGAVFKHAYISVNWQLAEPVSNAFRFPILVSRKTARRIRRVLKTNPGVKQEQRDVLI
jgi:hypothetical protein